MKYKTISEFQQLDGYNGYNDNGARRAATAMGVDDHCQLQLPVLPTTKKELTQTPHGAICCCYLKILLIPVTSRLSQVF